MYPVDPCHTWTEKNNPYGTNLNVFCLPLHVALQRTIIGHSLHRRNSLNTMHTFGHTANTKYIFASALTEGSANEMTWEKHLTIPIVIADDTKVTQALLHLLASRPTSPADEETLLSLRIRKSWPWSQTIECPRIMPLKTLNSLNVIHCVKRLLKLRCEHSMQGSTFSCPTEIREQLHHNRFCFHEPTQ